MRRPKIIVKLKVAFRRVVGNIWVRRFIGVGIPIIFALIAWYFRELMVQTMLGVYSGIALCFIVAEVPYCVLISPKFLTKKPA